MQYNPSKKVLIEEIMEVIPAVDLMKGKVVRLKKGDPNTSVNYNNFGGPLQTAKKWEREGAKTIHVIDLDAAMGKGDNLRVITSMIQNVKVHIQVGGGIRSIEKAELILGIGAERVILATLAFKRIEELRDLLKKYSSEKIMVALDYLNEQIMISGWTSTTEFTLDKAIQRYLGLGVRLYLLTSISKDGLLTGPDYMTLRNMVRKTKVEIFAAGGISSLEDLAKLKQIGVRGAIVGKALYEGRFNLREAIRMVRD